MPIRTLEQYLFELHVVTNSNIDVLRNAVVGIEVDHYLTRLFTPKKEPNFEAIGGIPSTLKQLIAQDLAHFAKYNLKPVFVFSGLDTELQHSYLEQPDLLPREKSARHVWVDKASPSRDQRHTEGFGELRSTVIGRPLYSVLMNLFNEHGVEYLVAPYSAWSQLKYMFEQKLVNCVFGSTDGLLLDDLDHIILQLEFDTHQFKHLDKLSILGKLQLNPKQFKDISMCVGNGYQPFVLNVFPQFQDQQVTFPALHHIAINGGSVFNALLNDTRCFDLYTKGCCAVQFMPVMKLNGRVEPVQIDSTASFLSAGSFVPGGAGGMTFGPDGTPSTGSSAAKESTTKVPEDLHEFVGQRLPDELYFYQSVGITSYSLTEQLVHDNAVERLPVTIETTPLYVQAVTSDPSLTLRGKALNILASNLNRYYQYRKYKLTTYFNGTAEYDIDQRVGPLFKNVSALLVRHATAKKFDLVSLLGELSNEYLEENTQLPSKTITSNHELIATAFLRSLVVSGVIASDFKLTPWGEALSFVAHSKHPEYLLNVLFFFQRFPRLTVKELVEPSDLQTAKTEHKDEATLISKFLALQQSASALENVPYLDNVSRPLADFRAVVDRIHSDMGGLVNTNVYALLLNNRQDAEKFLLSTAQWRELATELPFNKPLPSVLLGIVAEEFFSTFLDDFSLSEASHVTNELFKGYFDDESSAAILDGFNQFKEVVALVKLLDDKKLIKNKPVVELFTKSEELVDRALST